MAVNKQWIYASKPNGEVGPEHFEPREAPMPEPGPGEVLVRTTLLSIDPASRAWMAGRTYPRAARAGRNRLGQLGTGRSRQNQFRSSRAGGPRQR